MKKMNKKQLIKKLFQDKLKRHDVGALSEIGIVEQNMREQWKENAERVDPEIGEQIWTKIQKEYKMSAGKRYLFRIRQPLIAACITIALIVGGYFFYTGIFILEKQEFVEVLAENDMLYVLPDSSKVWMHPESTIRYAKNFTKDRKVWLKGSSLFEVQKYPGSKFQVYIEKAFIEVKGTKFLVEKIENGKNEITLFHGCIAFNAERTGEEVIMKPLQQIVYDPSDSRIQTWDIENIEWQHGKFKFNAMPLQQLLHIVNQIYNTHIVFEGKGENSPFSGTIRQDESLADVVDKICFIMNLHKKTDGDKIVISN
ncbi:FecR family protein [Bacteroides congonensis]